MATRAFELPEFLKNSLNNLFIVLWISANVASMLALMLPFGLAFGGLAAIGAIAGVVAAVALAPPGCAAASTGRRKDSKAALPAAISSLADDLSEAVARNEFFLVHQPKMRARSGEVQAVETLIRWRHPTRGLIGPNDFIALAEERGEMRRITEWVIRQTIVEQASLAACGHAMTFNVNISARVLPDRDFAEWALATVSAASGPIGFEITETAMIADPEGALRNLHLFADAGIKIAIDDYGAGLSSLAYLKQLPAHELKIDRMFISGLSSQPSRPAAGALDDRSGARARHGSYRRRRRFARGARFAQGDGLRRDPGLPDRDADGARRSACLPRCARRCDAGSFLGIQLVRPRRADAG